MDQKHEQTTEKPRLERAGFYNFSTGKWEFKKPLKPQKPQKQSPKKDTSEQSAPEQPKLTKGTKRALLIGINYFGTQSELQGCHNDVDRVYKLLLSNCMGYNAKDITILKDDRRDPKHQSAAAPTRRNIVQQMQRLANLTTPDDTLFIHYSGHGYYTRSYAGGSVEQDEKDGRDEMICPVDHTSILDDELHQMLVERIPIGAKLRCIFDCCHSGTILDLRHRWQFDHKSYDENTTRHCVQMRCAEKDAIMISGCLDRQTSADAYINGAYAGALTWGLCESLDEATQHGRKPVSSELTWKDIIYNIRFKLQHSRYQQIPQLSYSQTNALKTRVDL